MHKAIRTRTLIAAMLLTGASIAHAQSGGPYQITQRVIASGVAQMAAGPYAISASLGQQARLPIGAGTYTIYSGFWSTLAGIVGVTPSCLLDIDGNNRIDALTDGLLILRALFGLTGTQVTQNATAPNATRTTWAQIQPAINVPSLDVDLDGKTEALGDGLIILRAMFSMTGSAVTTGTIAAGAQRPDWNSIRGYLNNSCGGNFAP